MAEDAGKQDEGKIDFTREGEALGYISLDQARVLAMRTAREAPNAYGRRFRNVAMAFDVVEDTETEDHYVVTLSFRPEGAFAGSPGQEQFFIEKEGVIALRQVLTVPGRRLRLPVIPTAVGVVIVGAIVAVAAVFAVGGFDGGSDGGAAVPAPTIAVPAPTPIPAIAPAIKPTATSTPLRPTLSPTVTTAPAVTAVAVLPTDTPAPTPTPIVREVLVIETPTPAPKVFEDLAPPVGSVAFRDHYYLTVLELMSWRNAAAYAESIGGHLVTIGDAAENRFLLDLAQERGSPHNFWIGLGDQVQEGIFLWGTGESSIYSNWNTGEPNNAGNEDYVMLDYDAGYAWNDVPVGDASPFIVEFEAKLDAGPTPTPIVQEIIEAATPTPGPTPFPPSPPAPGSPKRGGTLTMAMVAGTSTLDPATSRVAVSNAITQSIYDNLLMIQPDLSLKPELATSWEANHDLSSYTFHLRQGVKFHHGKDFRTEDVLFTFNRLLDPVVDSPARSTFSTIIKDIVAIDDYTVRFDLTGPNSFFPDSLAIYQARILPADVKVERLTLEEFGTGPFIIAEHLPGERTTMVRNPDYWEEGKPYLDEIVILNIPEPATQAATLKSGEVDIVYNLEPQSVPGLEAHPDTTVLKATSFSWTGYYMDTRVPPFDSLLVRKAMQAATDRESINQAALLGLGTPARDHPIHPSYPVFADQYAPPDYDPELAKSLLEQAGYPDGIDITIHTAYVRPGQIEMAVAFQESAAPAGIRVNVQRVPSNGFWDVHWMVDPMTTVYWTGRLPDQALSVQYMSEARWNAPRYFNDELDALIVRARGQSLENQKVTYAEIQRILIENVPRVVVAYEPWLYGARKDVLGVAPHPLGYAIIQDAWLGR